MMGIILQVVQETVVEVGGEDLWDVMTERAGVDGIYSRLDSYPMSEFLALLDALAAELSLSVDEAMAVAGERAFPHLYSRWPEDQRHYEDPISLIEALNQPELVPCLGGLDIWPKARCPWRRGPCLR